jgi:hypothetical protein
MRIDDAKAEFTRRLPRPLADLTAREGVAAMLAFYAHQRADDVDLDADGDMLLYQWGPSDSPAVGGRDFRLDLVRQFITPDEDEPYQLTLAFHFAPADAWRVLHSGNHWCASPQELDAFRQFVESSPAFTAVADSRPARVDLSFSRC